MEIKQIEITKIQNNTGQIDGVPSNPRKINDEPYDDLIKSLKEDPEMLELRPVIVFPVKNFFVAIAGNRRFSACKELKYKKIPCIVLPKNTPAKKLRAIAIKDNVSAGEWHFEQLLADWDKDELKDWGLDIPIIEEEGDELPDDLSGKLEPQYKIEIVCENEDQQEKAYNKLIGLGYDCKILTL